ncbi:DUF1648 domain-containing protein [Phycisphaerales bacterium]|nr:DUF1648 domain-containing protein [Phycisphaerales bacterium]
MTKYGGIFQNKFKRPKVRPARNWIDLLLDLATLDIVLFSLGYAIWVYPSLPATIPTKFNAAGQTISTGPAAMVFLMPAIGLVICVILRSVQHWPWLSNTIVEITEENAEVQYRLVNRLLGWSGVLVSGLFLFIEIMIVRGATAGATTTNTGGMIAAVAIAPWFPLLGWYFWASFKAA